MTAKEYLWKIQRLDSELETLISERNELEKAQTFLRSPQVDGDRVQTSPSGDPPWMGYIIKWDELTNRIGEKWDELIEERQKVIKLIYSLEDSRHIEILYKKYVEHKRFTRIAREIHYSVDRIWHLHGEALVAFQQVLADKGVV